MKMLYQLLAVPSFALIAAGVGCRESKKKGEVVNVAQDTMLLRDLSEANKNTAEAAGVDNSLNTVRTSGGGPLPGLVNDSFQPRPSGSRVVVRPSPGDSQMLTPPVKANDAAGPTTVPAELSPASGSPSSDPCDSPASVDQRSCLNRLIDQNDVDLNRTYQNLIAESRKVGGSELEERLRRAQRNWVDQRDVECRGSGEGSLWARGFARCLAGISAKRTAELQRNLDSLRRQ
ncbi:MAG: DUF1311 domain-containing protein [Gemmatimonadota bacterium]|nr:DUF1311 domain-containing protein [Gemmatimonadota bacterium]